MPGEGGKAQTPAYQGKLSVGGNKQILGVKQNTEIDGEKWSGAESSFQSGKLKKATPECNASMERLCRRMKL